MNLSDKVQIAINRLESEYGYQVEIGEEFWYVWSLGHCGKSSNADGFIYLREGCLIRLEDLTVVVRAVEDNGLNAGEARLTGFAAVSVELIAGAIETALESI
jgi:hypothetical protein